MEFYFSLSSTIVCYFSVVQRNLESVSFLWNDWMSMVNDNCTINVLVIDLWTDSVDTMNISVSHYILNISHFRRTTSLTTGLRQYHYLSVTKWMVSNTDVLNSQHSVSLQSGRRGWFDMLQCGSGMDDAPSPNRIPRFTDCSTLHGLCSERKIK